MRTQLPVKERIEQLDIIRGFALFGVLLVNLTMLDETMFSHQASPFVHEHLLERFFAILLQVLASGKFYSLFAILFGAGSVMFLRKFESDQEGVKIYRRRLLVLFGIGICHLIFVWYGDILHVYAIAGFLVLSKRHLKAKQLLTWSVGTFIFSTLLFSQLGGSGSASPEMNVIITDSIEMYQQSDYLQLLSYRLTWELPMILINLVIVLPKIMSMFFLGAALTKMGVFDKTVEMKLAIIRLFRVSMLLSLIFASGYLIFSSGVFSDKTVSLSIVFEELLTVSGALFYASTMMLLTMKHAVLNRIRPLGNVGRMALTNYLTQTIFFTTLLFGYGGGLFQELPPWSYLPIAMIFFISQMGISTMWLRKYNHGPFEFVWRKLTYRQIR